MHCVARVSNRFLRGNRRGKLELEDIGSRGMQILRESLFENVIGEKFFFFF